MCNNTNLYLKCEPNDKFLKNRYIFKASCEFSFLKPWESKTEVTLCGMTGIQFYSEAGGRENWYSEVVAVLHGEEVHMHPC